MKSPRRCAPNISELSCKREQRKLAFYAECSRKSAKRTFVQTRADEPKVGEANLLSMPSAAESLRSELKIGEAKLDGLLRLLQRLKHIYVVALPEFISLFSL